MNLKEIKETLTEKQILEYKDNAIEMTTYAGQRLDDIVLKLEKLRKLGKLSYYANFNGTKLYSIDVTMNSAYKECLNCTRKTWLRRKKGGMKKESSKLKNRKNMLPKNYLSGKKKEKNTSIQKK